MPESLICSRTSVDRIKTKEVIVMMFSRYLRIERKAGGVMCTDREFIKACRSMHNSYGLSHSCREARHEFIRDAMGTRNAVRKFLR
mgnify:CR=1 FL=1|jgi:hypothetical protein